MNKYTIPQPPRVVLTAPERIYIRVSDDDWDKDGNFPADAEGVTWCADSVLRCEVEYERADRIAEMEIACAQAVEFAQYVVGAAKGGMVARAEHFLSLPYAQKLAERLNIANEAQRA